jgi:putative CocE/NonD family hydrolase
MRIILSIARRSAVVVVAGLTPAALLAQGTAPSIPPPAARYQFHITRNVMVPMRDGVKLAADVYRPTGAGEKLPVVLIRTGYNKEVMWYVTEPAKFFAGQGYIVVTQDVRGKFNSEGDYVVEREDHRDGYDTIDWIAKQPWSTGKIGTYGCSYMGEVQYLTSQHRHPNHTAMIPQSASGATGSAGGFYTNFGTYEGGTLTLSTIFGWFGGSGTKVKGQRVDLTKLDFAALLRTLPVVDMAKKAGFPPTDFEDFVSHPPADPYWDAWQYLSDDDRFDTPALHVNSWMDVTPEQTMYVFNLMRKNGVSPRARDNQFVIMSPSEHCRSEYVGNPTKVGDREFGDARLPYFQIYLDWFDYWLKGIENGATKAPKVRYYVMGKNEWRSADRWPVPTMRSVSYYLSSSRSAVTSAGDGLLATAMPNAGSATFTYDPANPFPSRGGTICCTGNPKDQPGVFDQSDLESRPDLLVYTTPPLERGVTIVGTVKAVLFVSSDAKDTDFTAKLLDVDPANRSWNVLNGVLRARYREGMTKAVWMEKNKVYRIEVSLKTTAHHFPAGHRIRLWISSSDFPLHDRNLNTGGDNVTETNWVTATNTVHHGGRYPSSLSLPIVPGS